jgi:hypothetical protein
MYSQNKVLKVHFIRKNPTLEKFLKTKFGITYARTIWNQILSDGGSVQDIAELDDRCAGW